MYVCEDKSGGKALLHFYTINTFCLEQEITCTLILLRWYFDTFTDTIFLSSWWRGISERDGSVYIPARKLKYLHAYLNVLTYNASRVLSSWEWSASGRRPNQSCAGRSRVVAQWSIDRWHHPAFFQFHYVNILELELRCAQHNDVQ